LQGARDPDSRNCFFECAAHENENPVNSERSLLLQIEQPLAIKIALSETSFLSTSPLRAAADSPFVRRSIAADFPGHIKDNGYSSAICSAGLLEIDLRP